MGFDDKILTVHDYRDQMWGHAIHMPSLENRKDTITGEEHIILSCMGHGPLFTVTEEERKLPSFVDNNKLKIGNYILLKMKSGKTCVFKCEEVAYKHNPDDMFEAKFIAVDYYEDWEHKERYEKFPGARISDE